MNSADSNDNPKLVIRTTAGRTWDVELEGLPGKGKTKTWTFHPPFALGRLQTVTLEAQSIDAWEVTSLLIKNPSLDQFWYEWECPGGFWIDGKPYDKAATYGDKPYGDKQVLEYNNDHAHCHGPTPPPTPAPAAVLGSCAGCRVDVYDDNGWGNRDRLDTYTSTLGEAAMTTWTPRKRTSIHSIKVSDQCKEITVGDDDAGSVNSIDHTDYPPPGVRDLPYDLQGDVLWIKVYPKQDCCVRHCPTSRL
jgi:hypothetical protein